MGLLHRVYRRHFCSVLGYLQTRLFTFREQGCGLHSPPAALRIQTSGSGDNHAGGILHHTASGHAFHPPGFIFLHPGAIHTCGCPQRCGYSDSPNISGAMFPLADGLSDVQFTPFRSEGASENARRVSSHYFSGFCESHYINGEWISWLQLPRGSLAGMGSQPRLSCSPEHTPAPASHTAGHST